MKIKSNAAPAELSSPFYKINEDFCREFEHYIASKNGKVKGKYNSWSYFVQGKITNPKPWYLSYKKATYTSTGNLILSSKKQSLLNLAEWSSPWTGAHNSEFEIRRKDGIGFLNRLFKNDFKNSKISKYYLISGAQNNPILIENLSNTLKPLFDSKEIYSIIIKNDTLTISLRTGKHHFDFFEKLFKL
jgi:hypothetical protein